MARRTTGSMDGANAAREFALSQQRVHNRAQSAQWLASRPTSLCAKCGALVQEGQSGRQWDVRLRARHERFCGRDLETPTARIEELRAAPPAPAPVHTGKAGECVDCGHHEVHCRC